MQPRDTKQPAGSGANRAVIYARDQHRIDRNLVDPDALKIISRLQKHGHAAFVVGGAVRDLLIGKIPKDFDVVTDAEPNLIKKLFRNSRIIGKRFRLVHIFFGRDKIIEVATFRSIEAGTFNNVFGCIEEDALRRDFTVNALYYDPFKEEVHDYVGGFKHLKARKLKPIIPLDRIFTEDPVRMIRAVKYSSTTTCRMGFFLRRRIRKDSGLMADVSPSRITEEVFKIMAGGHALPLVRTLRDFGLFKYLMPRLDGLVDSGRDSGWSDRFYRSLGTLDSAVKAHHESRRSIQLSYFIADYLFGSSQWANVKRLPFAEVYADIKDLLKPVTPPNVEVEKALVYLIRKRALYQKWGTLPLAEPELERPPQFGGDFGDPLMALEGAVDADMDEFREQQQRRRRRRPGSPHVNHAAAVDKSTEPAVPGQAAGDGAPAKKRRPRRRRKGSGGGAGPNPQNQPEA